METQTHADLPNVILPNGRIDPAVIPQLVIQLNISPLRGRWFCVVAADDTRLIRAGYKQGTCVACLVGTLVACLVGTLAARTAAAEGTCYNSYGNFDDYAPLLDPLPRRYTMGLSDGWENYSLFSYHDELYQAGREDGKAAYYACRDAGLIKDERFPY